MSFKERPGDKPLSLNEGFTLLELLVCCVVIVALTALLLPIFKNIRNSSNAIGCVSNLRTLGRVLHIYISENNGHFPPSRGRNEADPNTQGKIQSADHWLYSPYFSGEGTPAIGHQPIALLPGKKPTSSIFTRPGARYKDAGIFWCPGDNNPTRRPLLYAAHSYGENPYIGNEEAYPVTPLGEPKPASQYKPSHALLSAVQHPSKIIFAMDHEAPRETRKQIAVSANSWPLKVGSARAGPANPHDPRVPLDRHNGRANALFIDGSVRSLSFEDLQGTGTKLIDPSQ